MVDVELADVGESDFEFASQGKDTSLYYNWSAVVGGFV